MTHTNQRWYPALIMRDAFGRFARLRVGAIPMLRRRVSRQRSLALVDQLSLF